MSAPPAVAASARAEVLMRRVELSVARRLPGRLAGTHRGAGTGPGSTAESSRPYQPGDDVRFLDWPVTARLGEPYVREHEAERELTVTALVDTTPSMAFGTVRWAKRDLAAAVVAALGVLTDRPGDRLGAVLFSGDPVLTGVPPRAGRRARLLLLRRLLAAPPPTPATPAQSAPSGSLAAACLATARQVRRPGLVVVVSDFLDADAAALTPALRALGGRHDVVAVEVGDPVEDDLPDIGVVGVVDPETGAAVVLDSGDPALRRAYREVAAEHRAQVAAALRSAGAGHVRVRTDGDWIAALARHVVVSRRVAGRRRSA